MNKAHRYARILAITLLSLLCGWRVSHDMENKHQLGHDGVMQYYENWYSHHIARFSHPTAHIFGYAIFFALAFAMYEGLTLLLHKIFARTTAESR